MAVSGNLLKTSSQDRTNLVAYWSVTLYDGVHTVEFEHGTTTGKRVLRVDGKEIIRREWMFKLVGDEKFTLGTQKAQCELRVDPLPHFAFTYSLIVDGKPYEKFTEKQNKELRSWAVLINTKRYKIVFEKRTMDVWVNGEKIETEHCFVDDGTEITFPIDNITGVLKTNIEDKKKGVIHQLYIEGKLVDEDALNYN